MCVCVCLYANWHSKARIITAGLFVRMCTCVYMCQVIKPPANCPTEAHVEIYDDAIPHTSTPIPCCGQVTHTHTHTHTHSYSLLRTGLTQTHIYKRTQNPLPSTHTIQHTHTDTHANKTTHIDCCGQDAHTHTHAPTQIHSYSLLCIR